MKDVIRVQKLSYGGTLWINAGEDRRIDALTGTRLPEAIAISRKAVDLDPLSVRAWYVLAICLLASRDLEAAREANQHAIAIDLANEFALTLLGTIELLERKPAVALAVFKRISGDSPNQLGFRLTGIAMAEHSLGHALESKQALDEASARTA